MDAVTKFKMVEKIITTEDDALPDEVKSLLGLSDHDFWDDLSDEAKGSIQRGLEESIRGAAKPVPLLSSMFSAKICRSKPGKKTSVSL